MATDDLVPLDFDLCAQRVEAAGWDSYEANLHQAAERLAALSKSQSSRVARLVREEEQRQVALGRQSWGPMLDDYVSLLTLTKATGEWFVTNAQAARGESEDDPRWWPIVTLNARLWRVGFEVYTLLQGGFGKGGLARARTMYEAALTARIIGDLGGPGSATPHLGLRYSACEKVERYKDALEYNRHAPVADHFPEEVIAQWKGERDRAVAEWGKELLNPNGWAQPLLPDLKKITLPHLEQLVDWEVNRPFYRLANHEVHPSSRGGATNTYVNLRGRSVHSTGRRFRGLGEPASMACHYLTSGLVSLIADTGIEPETKTTLAMATVVRLADGVDEAATRGSDRAEAGASDDE